MKAVLFDIGGVVMGAGLERYKEQAEQVFRCGQEALMPELAHHIRELETGMLTSYEFWDRVGQSLMNSGEGRRARPRELAGMWSSLMLDSLVPNRPLLWLLQVLAANGVIVGAVSNTIHDHAEILENRGYYVPFSPCVLSCRVGLRKPDPEIYRLAARLSRVSPYQCLVVDDNADNLPAAQSLGMIHHHYHNNGSLARTLRNHQLISAAQLKEFLTFEEPPFVTA